MRYLGLAALAAGLVGLAPPSQAAVDGPKVEWKLASFGKSRPGTACMDTLADMVAAETNGRFTIKIAYGETLSPAKEIIDGIKIGAFETGFWSTPYAPGKQPAATVFTLPFLPLGDAESATRIGDVYYRHPAVKRDFDAWDSVYLMPVLVPAYEFIGGGSPPADITNWRGKRVRALGGQGEAMGRLGAATANVPSPEVYGALDKGLIDAAALPYYAFSSFKLYEVSEWYTKGLDLGSILTNVPVNKAAYEKLPPQYKELLAQVKPKALAAQVKALDDDDAKTLALLKSQGLKEIAVPAAVRQEIVKMAAQPIWDAWIEDITAKGYPGRVLFDVILNEAKKARS